MFAMKIELEPDVPGAELIAAAEAETLLAFEGTLQLRRTFDGRFARDGQDARGAAGPRPADPRAQLHVTRVREPNAEERRASSAVWLEGVVAEPPQVSRHPELPSVQLGRHHPARHRRPPSRFPRPPSHDRRDRGGQYRSPDQLCAGRGLVSPGQPRADRPARSTAAWSARAARPLRPSSRELDGEWAQHKAELVGKPQELQQAQRRYRQQRMRFEESPRLYVLALSVELITGEPAALEETYEQRRAWVREQRQQREERRARTAAEQQRRAAAPRPERAEPERSDEAPVLEEVADGEGGEAQPLTDTIKATRPRRRMEAAVVSSGNGIDEEGMGEVETQPNIL